MYQKMYNTLFNAVTDAIENLQKNNIGLALNTLIKAQQDTEEVYVRAGEEDTRKV